jgi:hypothetical protein
VAAGAVATYFVQPGHTVYKWITGKSRTRATINAE